MIRSAPRVGAFIALVALAACGETLEPQPSEGCATLRIECPNEARATEDRVRTSCAADVSCTEFWSCVAKNAVCDGRGRFDEPATFARCGDAGTCGASDADVDATVDVAEDTAPEDVATDSGTDAGQDTADAKSDTRTDARVDARTDTTSD